ncbi:MAG: GNAT family N-acetyltransferase [Comamonas sp.]
MTPYFATLTLPGVILRPWHANDAESFVQAAHESTATVGRWMDWCTPDFTHQHALNWFVECRDKAARFQAYESGIFSAINGSLLGGAALNHIDHDNRLCNLGYWVRQSAQRQGIALRTAQALIAHAFTALNMQRIEIVVAEGNIASEALARQAGAKWECLARNRLQLHGAAVPAHVFSVVPW